MKYGKYILAACFIFVLFSCASKKYNLEELQSKKLKSYAPPQAHVVTLKNGLQCFFLEDHTLPVVRAYALVKAGTLQDPQDKVGLSEITSALLDYGGAGNLGPSEVDKRKDTLGIELNSSAGKEFSSVSLHALSEDLHPALELFLDTLFQPQLNAKRLQTIKKNLLEELKREKDNPQTFVEREFSALLFGRDNPWVRQANAKSVATISQKDVRAFHQKAFVPSQMMLAVSGDFHEEEVVDMLQRYFDRLPAFSEAEALPQPAPLELAFQAETKHLARPLTQSFIRMGHLGIKRSNPDKYALLLLNYILGGGGFSSRLMADIRVKRGLAYGISSEFSPQTDYGDFTISVATKSSSTNEVIERVKQHLEVIVEEGVTEHELALAKDALLNQLIFAFDAPEKIVKHEVIYAFYGYPKNYLEIYKDEIGKVTTEKIKKVAEKYLHPEALKILILGPKMSEQ